MHVWFIYIQYYCISNSWSLSSEWAALFQLIAWSNPECRAFYYSSFTPVYFIVFSPEIMTTSVFWQMLKTLSSALDFVVSFETWGPSMCHLFFHQLRHINVKSVDSQWFADLYFHRPQCFDQNAPDGLANLAWVSLNLTTINWLIESRCIPTWDVFSRIQLSQVLARACSHRMLCPHNALRLWTAQHPFQV